MRVLVVHSQYRQPGGEDQYVKQQVDALRQSFEVGELIERNIDLDRFRAAGSMAYSRSKIAAVEKKIRQFCPDIVHLHNPYPSLGPAVHLATSRTNTPLVVSIHNYRMRCPNGYFFTEGSLCTRCEAGNYLHALAHPCFPSKSQSLVYAGSLWIHRFVLRLENRVKHFVAPSEYVGAQLTEWGIEPDKVSVIRNFAPTPPTYELENGSYGMYLGRLSSEKGVDRLLMALAAADDLPFRIVGDGPEMPRLRYMVDRLNLRNVSFHGLVEHSQAQNLLRGCAYLVAPSLWHENAPLAVVEALGHGKPILVSPLGGLPELATGGGGLVVDPLDTERFAEALSSLANDPALWRRLGVRSRAYFELALTLEAHVEQLKRCYEKSNDRK